MRQISSRVYIPSTLTSPSHHTLLFLRLLRSCPYPLHRCTRISARTGMCFSSATLRIQFHSLSRNQFSFFFCFPLFKYVCRPSFPTKELGHINHFIILYLKFNFSSFDSPPYFPFHYILIFIRIVCTFRNPYLSLFVPVSIAYESLAVY